MTFGSDLKIAALTKEAELLEQENVRLKTLLDTLQTRLKEELAPADLAPCPRHVNYTSETVCVRMHPTPPSEMHTACSKKMAAFKEKKF